ncbi:ABC transporter permease [Bacillus sp. AGMB 02131]|uniref:ABC transporter permease n=1 Tax=Peribacillus faecalis TaxID=2772559 RepID=A0A927CW65_9BACI|nr:ABC transporter permease [Peribacillus faecalis]MBD3108903.1 ABC transporter permease [Peribacillus faecalis]
MKIIKLALANIRKSKLATGSLFIFILVAALLLNVGLMVMTQVNAFFDDKVEQLKDPHVILSMDHASFQSDYEAFIKNYPGVTSTEKEEMINMEFAKFAYGNSELSNEISILNADYNRSIGTMKLVEKLNDSSGQDIFVPYSFKTNGGYELGDDLNITYQDIVYEYRIAGFFETTMMGMTNFGVMKFALPEASYRTLADELDNGSKGWIISAVMEDKTQSTKLMNDFKKEFPLPVDELTSNIWRLDIETVKSVNTMTVNIVTMILVAFAVMIVLVSLIVIKYRISNSIEDGMANIGILKAIGYTSRQIISSIILQFVFITFSASVVGVALSYALMPMIGGIITSLSGLIWIVGFDMLINLICIALVVISVVIVTLLSAFRIRSILPIAALRGGIQTHSFRKNHFPLEKEGGGLHVLLAIKSMLSNVKQNFMILLIIIALTFASVFSVVLYYNIASDKTAFVNLFGVEYSNVMIYVKPDADVRELRSNLEKMDDVRKVIILDSIATMVDGQNVETNITDNFNQLENNIVFEGRQPKYENEISISWVVSNQINKGLGDTVEVDYGAETERFLVTGISQSMSHSGQVASLTRDGMQRMYSDYQGSTLYVYLNGISNKNFIENVQKQYGDYIVDTIDLHETLESQITMYTTAVFAVMLMVLIITVIVVVMILYLVIKTMIIKSKKEFGVMKAIGYSTIQLMYQISISFLPVITAGVAIGGALGYFLINPMLSVVFSSAGINRLDFIVHLPNILIVCAALLVLGYVVSMIVSLGIRKISAYSLMRE